MTMMTERQEWIEEGKQQRKDFLLVVCDTFSYEDYPVYSSAEKLEETRSEYSKNMQSVHEVIDLRS